MKDMYVVETNILYILCTNKPGCDWHYIDLKDVRESYEIYNSCKKRVIKSCGHKKLFTQADIIKLNVIYTRKEV